MKKHGMKYFRVQYSEAAEYYREYSDRFHSRHLHLVCLQSLQKVYTTQKPVTVISSWVPGTRTFRSHAISFPGTKLPSNIRSRELSSPTTVALMGRRSTRYSVNHELFN